MKKDILDEIIACLPEERTLFYYFKGQYAFFLLNLVTEKISSIRSIKLTPFQSLLNQPDIRDVVAKQGNGHLTPQLFGGAWKETSQPFVLTVDRWGNSDQWQYQTTRKGCNLVLQLNFSEKHNRAYHRLVKPEDEFVFNFSGHPAMERSNRALFRETLAWARIDFDLDKGEALIEEIQSDWVRRVQSCLNSIRNGANAWLLDWCDCKPEDFILYVEKIMAPYVKLWQEAMLTATVQFIQQELGIYKIYYHSHLSGAKVKGVYGGAPPRSLYSDLPRKFCFQLTDEGPLFIGNDRFYKRKKRALKRVTWYKLEI